MSKKGQVSFYILLGIIILFFLAYIFYLSTEKTKVASDSSNLDALGKTIPDEFIPFKRYVENCGNDLLEKALRKAGVSGGEIYSREMRQYNYYNPVQSEGLEVFPQGNLLIPYWTYVQGSADCSGGCTKVYQIPHLNGLESASVQSQVQRYIEENMKNCTRLKATYENTGVTYKESGFVKVNVTFGEKDVSALISYPLELNNNGKKINITAYRATSNLPFKQYYDKALYLSAISDQNDIFEKATLNWISIYSGMDNAKLPPKADMDLDYVSSLAWTKEQVKNNLKDIARSNIRLFTVQGSKNYHKLDSDLGLGAVYNNTVLPNSEYDFSSDNVNFDYDGWEMYLKLNNDVQVLRPESANMDWFPFFGINRIRTLYSITYPVKITISNPNEFAGTGFEFSFATEVNVRDNDVLNISSTPFDYSIFENMTTSKTMLCDIFNSENVSFKLYDGKNNTPLGGVYMNYVCADEVCPIGNLDESGVFNQPLPVCMGARLQLLKPDYETIFLIISPNIDSKISLGDIQLEPYRYKNMSVRKWNYNKNSLDKTWYLADSPVNVDDKEKIIVQLERLPSILDPSFVEKQEFSTFGVFAGGNMSEMRLLPGQYTGSIIGVLEDPVVFDPNERCTNAVFEKKCYMVPNETMTMEKYAGGGAYFNENTTFVNLVKSSLDTNKSVIEFKEFFINIPDIPQADRVIEDLGKLSMLENLSVSDSSKLNPVFK